MLAGCTCRVGSHGAPPPSTFTAFILGGTSILVGLAVRPLIIKAYYYRSLTLAGVVSRAMKVTVGRLRPDLIPRCLSKPGSGNAPVFRLVITDICTQMHISILKDGFRSFPSGHTSCTSTLPVPFVTRLLIFGSASVSFAGLEFLSFYLAGRIHLFIPLSRLSLHSL